MEHLAKRTEDEFKQPNMQVISDDEVPVWQMVTQANIEHQRMYNKYELQMDIKSDTEHIAVINRQSSSTTVIKEENVLKWLLKECGLGDEYLKKMEDQQINHYNIAYLS
jgi:hypothetical protein